VTCKKTTSFTCTHKVCIICTYVYLNIYNARMHIHTAAHIWHDLGCCVPRPAHSGWYMDHGSPVAWLALLSCTVCVCVLGSPGAQVHLGHQCTGSHGALVHLGAPVHWFTWCTGSPGGTSALVHMVHWFTWGTGSPGAPVHGSPGALVHLGHRCTWGTAWCTGSWFTWGTGALVHMVHWSTWGTV